MSQDSAARCWRKYAVIKPPGPPPIIATRRFCGPCSPFLPDVMFVFILVSTLQHAVPMGSAPGIDCVSLNENCGLLRQGHGSVCSLRTWPGAAARYDHDGTICVPNHIFGESGVCSGRDHDQINFSGPRFPAYLVRSAGANFADAF